MKATIPKGTTVWGTFPAGRKIAGRTYVVEVWSTHPGWLPETPYDAHKGLGMAGEVCWIGGSGYWHYAAAEDVQLDISTDGYVTRQELAQAREALLAEDDR